MYTILVRYNTSAQHRMFHYALTMGAFRVTHEVHDVSFYPSLLFDEQQGQIMHYAFHA